MIDAAKILLPRGTKAINLHVVTRAGWESARRKLPPTVRTFAESQGFDGVPLTVLPVSDAGGRVTSYYIGAPQDGADPFSLGSIVSRLPAGHYRFAEPQSDLTALAWCNEQYRYDPYRPVAKTFSTLEILANVDGARMIQLANATFLVRDLVNTPANIMGPNALEAAARQVAKTLKARVQVIAGTALRRDFPLIHAVGAASAQAPRLVDIRWGNIRHPKVTLVGKGVCFDTGGLDIKPSAGMVLMKKDMGGAATVLGLAQLIIGAKLPVRLRVLLPIVENSIASAAFRPGDVFKSRKGLTVEIGNTDAEGRLILADALALADEEAPELLIDMATLTGAARVALGPDLPPFYTDDDRLAAQLTEHSFAVNDPLWRLPLWKPYNSLLESPIADMNNAGAGGFAGSITAALFLRRFIVRAKHHIHFDIFAWVPAGKPGRPKGGEAQAMRAVFSLLCNRYGVRRK